MNIFILSDIPFQAAKFHCDKHVISQLKESVQMLGAAVIRHGATSDQMPLTKKGTPLKAGRPNFTQITIKPLRILSTR